MHRGPQTGRRHLGPPHGNSRWAPGSPADGRGGARYGNSRRGTRTHGYSRARPRYQYNSGPRLVETPGAGRKARKRLLFPPEATAGARTPRRWAAKIHGCGDEMTRKRKKRKRRRRSGSSSGLKTGRGSGSGSSNSGNASFPWVAGTRVSKRTFSAGCCGWSASCYFWRTCLDQLTRSRSSTCGG